MLESMCAGCGEGWTAHAAGIGNWLKMYFFFGFFDKGREMKAKRQGGKLVLWSWLYWVMRGWSDDGWERDVEKDGK